MSSDDDVQNRGIRSPHWRVIFSNTFSMNFGDNDVKLGFSVDLAAPPKKEIIEEVMVTMTPRSAKILSHALASVIANFEATNGPISVPAGRLEGISKKLNDQRAAAIEKQKEQGSSTKKGEEAAN